MTAMGTVLLELILTRLFSVTAGYHFAFMIVSITMFGMTLGAIVTLARMAPNTASVIRALIINAIGFSISTVAVLAIYNSCNQILLKSGPLIWISATFVLFSLPFYFSGVCICLCLSRFQGLGKLYAADLIGAGLSCLLLVAGLTITDAQNILVTSGLLGALGAICFALHQKTPASKPDDGADRQSGTDTKSGALLVSALAAAVVCAACYFTLPPQPVNVLVTDPIEYVKWSPIGRVVVTTFKGPAVSWAKVPISNPPDVDQKGLYIDFGAFTVMTSGAATPPQLEPIRQDVTAVGNILRPNNSVFIIGVGGGRDVLTGLLFGQKTIDGIEVNPVIVQMLRQKYADFSGDLSQKPGVR